MDNILDLYKAYVNGNIEDKTLPFSISKFDVGDGLKNLADFAFLIPEAKIEWTYPKDFLTRDSAFNLYISILDNVSGDTTIDTNWQLVSSASGSKQVWDLILDSFPSDAYEVSNGAISAYKTSDIYISTPDVPNTGACTLEINSLGALPIRKASSGSYVALSAGDFSTTSFLVYRGSYFLLMGTQGGVASAYTETITCDGIIISYTIAHGKANFAPSVAVWFLDTDNNIWQPLDVTQGIIGSATDNNVIYFNPTVYRGNDNGFIYKLTITG